MHGPGSVAASQAQDLARPADVGSFQFRVRVDEVHDRSGVDDEVYLAGKRVEVFLVQAEQRFCEVPDNGNDALRPFGFPQPIASQVGLDGLHPIPTGPDEAVDACVRRAARRAGKPRGIRSFR